jgi:hypothetical protein
VTRDLQPTERTMKARGKNRLNRARGYWERIAWNVY